MRTFLLLMVAVLAVGCGKSFTELDAIYKDELSVLEQIHNERDVAYGDLYRKFHDPVKTRWTEVIGRYDAAVEAWKEKHQKAMEKWGAEHENEWTTTEYDERRQEFEKTLQPKPTEPPSSLQFFTREEDEAYRAEAKQISDRFAALIDEQEKVIKRAKERKDAAK